MNFLVAIIIVVVSGLQNFGGVWADVDEIRTCLKNCYGGSVFDNMQSVTAMKDELKSGGYSLADDAERSNDLQSCINGARGNLSTTDNKAVEVILSLIYGWQGANVSRGPYPLF